MAEIQYDKLTQANQALKTMRQEFLDGVLTVEELREREALIKAEKRVILGLPLRPVA